MGQFATNNPFFVLNRITYITHALGGLEDRLYRNNGIHRYGHLYGIWLKFYFLECTRAEIRHSEI